MDLPFLEVSVISTSDKEFSRKHFIKNIYDWFVSKYTDNCTFIDQEENSYVHIDYSTYQAFEKIYLDHYHLYVHIFEDFIQQNEDLAKSFQRSFKSKTIQNNEIDTDNSEEFTNYLILRYKSNHIAPIRRYYIFMTKVYKFFGVEIVFEEIEGGFLRFIHTKEDYEILQLPGDLIETWKGTLKIRGIDQNQPQIQQFFTLLEEWKKKSESEQKILNSINLSV